MTGGSRFEDVELRGSLTPIVDGYPPVMVAGRFACREITLVEQSNDAGDWKEHLAPRKQWVIVTILCTTPGSR